MADLPLIPFVEQPDPDRRFVLDEAGLCAELDAELALLRDFEEAQRELEALADGPPAFLADPSDEYLKAIEQVETCLRQRRAANG
ncbi:hypothetical protein [Bradyrhizobium roseum]|uniref:hypothetical protein n=1 Tax=Bradyrhizobium roseum TaxID=3056648 RepID=UPI00262F56E0|nr:hypothetical protein [Bradyrhizobium roseus]WKA31575.1 hypothetical protein QUH67_16070 [Bradyrhizobium roseus]